MKNIFFLISQLNSDAPLIGKKLSECSRIEYTEKRYKYNKIGDIYSLNQTQHKCDHSGAIIVEGIYLDQQLNSKYITNNFNLIFFIGDPIETIKKSYELGMPSPVKTYFNRTQKMYRIAKRSKNCTIITYKNNDILSSIYKVLDLDYIYQELKIKKSNVFISNELEKEILDRYENYLFKFKKLNFPIF